MAGSARPVGLLVVESPSSFWTASLGRSSFPGASNPTIDDKASNGTMSPTTSLATWPSLSNSAGFALSSPACACTN